MKLPPLDSIVAEQCRRRFFRLVTEMWETIESAPFVYNWHIEYLCDELQKALETWERGESQLDLYINIPPGTSKSSIVTILFPVFCWVRQPQMRIMSASYSEKLSTKHALKSRDCLKSQKFQRIFPGKVTFKRDADGKTNYANEQMGERFVTSVGGTATGNHADLIIVDDPTSAAEANSEAARNVANDFVFDTLTTRKTDKARTLTIVVMQRLHERDVTGYALAKFPDTIRLIRLPGELTVEYTTQPPELAKKYTDKLLDHRRLTRAELAKAKVRLGTLGYAGQFGQQPTPPEGGIIKRAWFGSISWTAFEEMTRGQHIVWDYDADTAFTKDTENDPSALLTSTYVGQVLYVREVAEVWEELPTLKKTIPAFIGRNGHSFESRLFVEPKASGKSVVQELRDITQINVVEAPSPSTDKVVRANAAAPFIEARRVVLIYGEPGKSQAWQDDFIDQCSTFPRAEHDDQLDTLTQAIARYQVPEGGLAGWE